jgi:hypothetical protein
MNFPPGLQFHENNRLLVWRPRGLLDEKVVSDVIAALGRLEMELHEPFNPAQGESHGVVFRGEHRMAITPHNLRRKASPVSLKF